MSQTNKKQVILDTALQLFVRQGFYATSTASIAKQAGVATGTLFHHFPSKDKLMSHLFLAIKQEFADAIQANALPNESLKLSLQHIWYAAIDWAMENPLKQEFFQQYSMSPSIATETRQQAMNSTLRLMGELIQRGQTTGELADFPLPLMLESCHGQFLSTTRYFLDHPGKWEEEHHQQSSFAMLWNSMKA